MINQVTLLGRVGKDPEIRFTPQGDKKGAFFSIATNELGKENTTWHNVQAWEKQAEIAQKFVAKGDLLYVQGRIKYFENNGKHYTAIVIQNMQFLSNKGGSQSQASNKDKPIPQPPQKRTVSPETVKQSDDLGDDDIPF